MEDNIFPKAVFVKKDIVDELASMFYLETGRNCKYDNGLYSHEFVLWALSQEARP
jgi:hypothetical protein